MAKIYDAVLRLTDQFSEPLKKAEKHLDNFERKYKETGKTFWSASKKTEAMGKNFSKYITAPIVAGAGLCVKSFKDVDEGLDIIVTKTGATGKDMKEFEDIFNNMSTNIPEDMSVIGEAIGEVNTQFGLTGETLEKASTQMVQFSKINGQDVTSASIKAKQSMDALGISGDKLDVVLDSVTKTAQNTGQSTDKIFDSITKNAPSLKALNLNYAQSAEFLGQLEKSGLDTSKTFSYMSKAQVNFAKEGYTLTEGLNMIQKSLKNASDETEKLNIMSEYFGTKGSVFMLDALNRGVLEFDKFANAEQDAMGSVLDTFNEVVDPIDKIKQVFNALKITGNKFFKASEEIWVPWLKKAINKLTDFNKKIEDMPEEKMRSIIKTLGGIAAIGPAFLVFSKGQKTIGKFFFKLSDASKAIRKAGGIMKWLTSPANLMVGSIMAIIIVSILLIKNWDKIKAKAEKVFPGISKTIARMGKNAATVIKRLWFIMKFVGKAIIGGVLYIYNKFKPILDLIGKVIKGLIKRIIGTLDGLLEFLAGVFTLNWEQMWKGIVKIFDSVFGGIVNIAKKIINNVIGFINKAIEGINKIKIPDFVPGLGGKGISIPLIPKLARGSKNWLGGLAEINERGGEIVDLPRGSRVIPHDESLKNAYTQGQNSVKNNNSLVLNIPKIAETMVIREDADIDKIINALVRELEIAKQNKINERVMI